MKKILWTKILGLSKDFLNQQGEDVDIIYIERKKKSKPKQKKNVRFFSIKKSKEQKTKEESISDTEQGQLVVDIYENEKDELVIESTIAGVKSKDIDITIEPDLIVIRGKRKQSRKIKTRKYYYQECFWGGFSRTIVLPYAIKVDQVNAGLKNGILTIILPKEHERDVSVQSKK